MKYISDFCYRDIKMNSEVWELFSWAMSRKLLDFTYLLKDENLNIERDKNFEEENLVIAI